MVFRKVQFKKLPMAFEKIQFSYFVKLCAGKIRDRARVLDKNDAWVCAQGAAAAQLHGLRDLSPPVCRELLQVSHQRLHHSNHPPQGTEKLC